MHVSAMPTTVAAPQFQPLAELAAVHGIGATFQAANEVEDLKYWLFWQVSLKQAMLDFVALEPREEGRGH